ncbi:transmembrane amino acid transporter protein-domain-containing protein [Cantharellus anzutake]|uniref:transmembrane amino acid transporter protein-domain-containing protein n=1 Tax=Cantharellus anzutake TaxID=1750568 RepID=UPI001903D674|nr:transmembrane amino acid transporter protein-domain-containing protein [Cantharellus anzutake]KAF8340300.1 transmembrane amino acid transporter protein-domain-containing protein [Cantharellus anzutake]
MSNPGPSKPTSSPVGIHFPGRQDDRPVAGQAQFASNDSHGTPASFGTPPPNIPPRFVSASLRPSVSSSPRLGPAFGSPSRGSPLVSGRASPAGLPEVRDERGRSGTPIPRELDGLPDEEKARVLRRHLVSREERGSRAPSITPNVSARQDTGGVSAVPGRSKTSSLYEMDDEEFPITYSHPGADITHNIYKWQSDARREALRRTRATSLIAPAINVDSAFQHIHEPGGFRRNYLLLRANEQGIEVPPMSNHFIDFLYLFGHFGGEDLEEDEDEEMDEDFLTPKPHPLSPAEAGLRGVQSGLAQRPFDASKPHEHRPLLPRDTSRSLSRLRRRQRSASGKYGDATVTQAVLMLLKSFIGTGILFLGKAFYNGGLLFSILTLTFIAAISLYSFILLIKTKFVVSGSFGDLGGILYGRWLRVAILTSIVISQLGFVSAYTIFIASNFQAVIMAVSNCRHFIPMKYLIMVQAIVLCPLSLVRNLARLSVTALIADAFILVGLIYIGSNEVAVIAERGIADVAMFNPKDFPLLIGTSVFAFEGIGLVSCSIIPRKSTGDDVHQVVPITDSMREPRKFPAVLSGVMIFLLFLFGGAGVLSYAAYGSSVQTVILVNLPQDQKFVQVVQFLYASAILLSVPLQLFPAVRIMENWLFTKSGKTSLRVKWRKNVFRFATVFGCYVVAWLGAADLDKFVSFIGSIPLCYVYPAMLHYKACARTRWARAGDIALLVFGLVATVFTTWQTIHLMMEPAHGEDPQIRYCQPASPGDSTPLRLLFERLGIV